MPYLQEFLELGTHIRKCYFYERSNSLARNEGIQVFKSRSFELCALISLSSAANSLISISLEQWELASHEEKVADYDFSTAVSERIIDPSSLAQRESGGRVS